MPEGQRNIGRWVLYACLFAVSAVAMLFASAVLSLIASFMLWLIVPTALVYGVFVSVCLFLFLGLLLVARRKRWGWLAAISLGGACVPGFMVVLMVLSPILPNPPRREKANQQQSVIAPSGKYILTVPIERSRSQKGPLGYGLPYWHVVISDPNGAVVYRDPEDKFAGIRNLYWTWGEDDRVWLYDSDDGTVYFYECVGGNWSRGVWGRGRTDHVGRDIAPPEALYPDYAAGGPITNLGTAWRLCGFAGSQDSVSAFFENVETGERMVLKIGESKNGITLLEWNSPRNEAVCEVNGKRVTMTWTLPSGRTTR